MKFRFLCVHRNEVWNESLAVQVPEHQSQQQTTRGPVERDERPSQMPVPLLLSDATTPRANWQFASSFRRV
jgi:hypothetical protein